MPSSTPTSVSRYRPAILVLTGAAAAYAAWLLYTSLSFANLPAQELRRSNAVRRPNRRPAERPGRPDPTLTRIRGEVAAFLVQRLSTDNTPLGEFDFFGQPVELSMQMRSREELNELANELQPHASQNMIQARIEELYDTLLDRALGNLDPVNALGSAELEHALPLLQERLSAQHGITQGLERRINRLSLRNPELIAFGDPERLTIDDVESIPPTEADNLEDDEVLDPDIQMLQRTLYHIAEDRARHEGVVHRGITCNGCNAKPIRGIRWHCANCADFDLCSDCEATKDHVRTHIFYKIRVPVPNLGLPKQEPLYPGRPYMLNNSIDGDLKRRLVKNTRMEAEEIEAVWDQFACLATATWATDPNEIGWALDRRAFNHAFIPRYSSFKSAPNLVYDRVFSYFDTDRNTLIGFEEFVKGIDGLHATDPHVKLRIAFNGYDVDGDGYISRKDVLRIFRAYYAIEREATRNYLAEGAGEMSVRGALDVIQSAQPLGSAFTEGPIEPGDPNWAVGEKPSDEEVNSPPIVENRDDRLNREVIIASTHPERDSDEILTVARGAIVDRWNRRQFYTDEEEGFVVPPRDCEADQPNEADEDGLPTPESERPRWSRSSSRVRFQDDIDMDARSNASTSSRPVGERWGGYEIPEPEKDLGKEVLYQITQQAFNELLDPLFKPEEDAAMDAFATRDERRLYVSEIDDMIEKFNTDRELLAQIVVMGPIKYVNCVLNAFCLSKIGISLASLPLAPETIEKTVVGLLTTAEASISPLKEPWDAVHHFPSDRHLWTMMLYRLQLEHELKQAMTTLATREGWMDVPKTSVPSPTVPLEPTNGNKIDSSLEIQRDPTLPQFRPNSLKDLEMPPPAGSAPETSDVEAVPASKPPFGPLFTIAQPPDASTSSAADSRPATEVGTAPYTLPNLGITLSRPITLEERSLHRAMHILSFALDEQNAANEQHIGICDEIRLISQHPALDPNANHPDMTFYEAIVAAAYSDWPRDPPVDQHLRIAALARLEATERRDQERKGGGKVSFEEFEARAKQGGMRFLESWMGWVSF